MSKDKRSNLDGNRVGGLRVGGGGGGCAKINANDCPFSPFPKLVFSAKKSLDSTLVLVLFFFF